MKRFSLGYSLENWGWEAATVLLVWLITQSFIYSILFFGAGLVGRILYRINDKSHKHSNTL